MSYFHLQEDCGYSMMEELATLPSEIDVDDLEQVIQESETQLSEFEELLSWQRDLNCDGCETESDFCQFIVSDKFREQLKCNNTIKLFLDLCEILYSSIWFILRIVKHQNY